MTRPAAVLVLAALALAACGGSKNGEAATPPATTPATPPPATPPVGAGEYDVHEWGLVRAMPGDILTAGAIAPAPQPELLTVDKPVLYFHAAAATQLRSVRVEADGAIVEVWPPAPRTGLASLMTWSRVALDPSGPCPPSPLPSASDTQCTALPAGDLCETPSLGTIRVPGVACVRTEGYTDSFLFYRARSRSFTPPLRFQRRHVHQDVDVTNEGSTTLPGWLVRLHRDNGRVRAQIVRPPAPGQTIAVPFALQPGPDAGRNGVRESLREIGLTDGEADAFHRAWDEALFAATPTTDIIPATDVDRLTSDETTADGELAPRESFLYFLSPADCDRLSRLTFDPPARDVRRAIAVWSSLRASGPGH